MDNHVKDFLSSVEQSNKGEVEFLQAVEEVAEAVIPVALGIGMFGDACSQRRDDAADAAARHPPPGGGSPTPVISPARCPPAPERSDVRSEIGQQPHYLHVSFRDIGMLIFGRNVDIRPER